MPSERLGLKNMGVVAGGGYGLTPKSSRADIQDAGVGEDLMAAAIVTVVNSIVIGMGLNVLDAPIAGDQMALLVGSG